MPVLPRLLAAAGLALAFGLVLSACGSTIALAPGLTARMDAAGAKLDTATALGLINHLRTTRGAPELANDPALEAAAQEAANAYARSGKSPAKPDGASAILTSAGYVTFAETFSGWRSSTGDTNALSDSRMHRAGLAVTWSGSSEFGSYWVLLLAE